MRELLESFMTFPRLIVPRSLSAPEPTDDGDAISVFVDSATPTPAMLRMLEFLTINSTQDRWLRLDAPDGSPLSGQARLATFAQRLILCKSLDPHRLYVPAPFEVSIESGAPHWRPTRDYIPWRTMLTFLAGKKAVGVLHPAEGVRAIVFDGAGGSCLFAWSQSAGGVPREFDAYLGNDARSIDLWGNNVTLASRDGRRRVPVGPVPIIVYDIDAPVLLLEASFRFEPRFVQIHKPEPRPILRFRNTGGARMAGELIIQAPDDWRVKPARDTFALDPGEEYRREVQITLPPRQLARDYQLLVELRLSAPEPRTLRFPVDLRVGLEGVDVYAVAWFEGDDLVVEQTLRNLSDEHVNFTAFCEPPGRRRLDSAFRDIGPGQTVRRTYVFPASRDLADAWLHYGVREIHGDRSLDLVVKAPH
ncbi:MAG: hypothetical protein D6744_17630 [Planctomycetota bacterium]|nr:MAG: hypothetical protein D6744_17630 [Planctomycetota bacterium]